MYAEREENMTQTNENSEVKNIALALYNKSKRAFKYRGTDLKKQALKIAPPYRDFILKIINNKSLKITQKWNDGYIVPEQVHQALDKLNRKGKSSIFTDISDPNVLPHELGHAVDFWFGFNKSLSSNVIIKDNKTLFDIFNEEFEAKQEEIYSIVMEEFKNIINSNINSGAYDLLVKEMPKYQLLLNFDYKNHKKTRQILQQELYKSGFVETYYQMVTKRCYSILNNKYSPILDALSSKHDFSGLWLDHHDHFYYQVSKKRAVEEFFANMFEAKIMSKQLHFDNLIKYLPKSFNAFEQLFVIVYDHIQNNKRFTDLTLKRREN